MRKLIVATLCASLTAFAMAEDASGLAEETVPPGQEKVQEPNQAAPAAPAASAVPAATPLPPGPAEPSAPAAPLVTPKSSVPLEKRRGGDITECLQAGSKSDKDIAACADKYRPR